MSSTQDTTNNTTQASSSGSSSSASNGATPAPSTAATNSSSSSAPADETLICRWSECNERFQNAEALYEHICEKHVGRKSTNNLNLTCQWNSCRTTTVKRDHITSHIRVHVPLKPHKCDFCGKSFKRPQDLKKHVKTHADDSVLVGRGPQDQNGAMNAGPYRHPGTKAPGYYDHNGQARGANLGHYGQPHQNGQASYYHSQQPAPGYHPGPVYGYPQPHMGQRNDYMGHQAAGFDARQSRRDYDENLNRFLGDIKRRQIDPTSYHQVQAAILPIATTMGLHSGGLGTEYMPQAPHTLAVAGAGPNPHYQHYTLPPMPSLRTKTDLEDIDNMLAQMQSTVYENSAVSPTGHYTNATARTHSPPTHTRHVGDQYMAGQAASPLTAASHSTGGTPAVTPPSSALSYTSGQSPTASSSGMSPTSRHSSTTVAYPSLPNRPNLPYPGLSSNFSQNERRLSGGVLQSSNRPVESGPVRPSAPSETNASPASSPTESKPDESYDSWIDTMRCIEQFRDIIRTRLETRDYENEPNDPIDPSLDRPVNYPQLPRLG